MSVDVRSSVETGRWDAGAAPTRGDTPLLDRLPAGTRWLLLLAAADEDMDAASLARAARAAGLDVADLAPAELAGLVRVAGGQVRFPRPSVRATVYEQAPLARRREAHVQVAEAAAATGAYDRASTALERAADLTGDPAAAGGRLLTAARYAWLSGQSGRARRLLRRVLMAAPGPAVTGGCQLLAGEIELRSAAAETALETLLAAADALSRAGRSDLALRALVRAGEAASFSGRHSRLPQIAARAGDLCRASGVRADDPRYQRSGRDHPVAGPDVLLAHIAGTAAALRGRHRQAADALRRCMALGRSSTDPTSLALCSTAGILLADHAAAWRFADDATEAARTTGEVAALPPALLLRAFAEYWLGRYDAAAATCREGWHAARGSGQQNYVSDHVAMLAVLAAIRGQPRECQDLLRGAALPPGGGRLCRPRALREWALAVLDVTSGRPADAVARLTGIVDPATGDGQGAILLMATPWLVEAARQADPDLDAGPAVAALACLDRWAGSTGGPLVRALSARCHALLAPRGSDAATERFQEALRLHGEAESEFERARTELLFGQELRRSRRPRDSRTHLHRARDTFSRLDLPAWVERATVELRAAGEQVEPSGERALTPQQWQIARLVAAGATNREVAGQLQVSPRTVDHHLRNIFVKLRIRSRVELARRLPDLAGG